MHCSPATHSTTYQSVLHISTQFSIFSFTFRNSTMYFQSMLGFGVPLNKRWRRHLFRKHVSGVMSSGSRFIHSVDVMYLIQITLLCGRVTKRDRKGVTVTLHTPFIVGYTDRGRRCFEVRVVVGLLPPEILTAYPSACIRTCAEYHSHTEGGACITSHMNISGEFRPCTCSCPMYKLTIK